MARKKSRAKAAAKATEAEEVFYVGVQDPTEVRRNVLESYRDAVHFLQQHGKLKALRAQKAQALEELRADVRELKKLVLKMKRVMPKTKLRVKLNEEHQEAKAPAEKKAEEKPKKKEKKKRHEKQPRPAKDGSELEQLESELSEIEHKLEKIA